MFFIEHKKRKITLLLGHSDTTPTHSSELATIYEAAAKKAGHEVRRFNLGEMKFDPILHKGYKEIQELEPDLKTLQEAINWSDHFVIIYPVWWSSMPALLKGLFDRMWLPGFAFHMRKTRAGTPAMGWRKKLKGKTARIIVLSGQLPFFIWLFFGDYTNELKMAILWFAGFKVKVSRIGPLDIAPEWKMHEWRKKMEWMGRHGQ